MQLAKKGVRNLHGWLKLTDEPDEIGEVGCGSFITDELEHLVVTNLVDVESERAHCDTNHALSVVEELDGFCVQRKVRLLLVEEKVDRLVE